MKTKTKAKTFPLFTIGYEQAKPAAVLNELRRTKIELVVDTRAIAASRRPGFSKHQLAASLDEVGIAYIHLQKLGTPAEGRAAAGSGDTNALWRIYDKPKKKGGRKGVPHQTAALNQVGKALRLVMPLPRPGVLPPQPLRFKCKKAHAIYGGCPHPAIVLIHSAGCGLRCLPSTLMISAT